MARRLIWIVIAVVVIGGLGFVAYDRYLGRELRAGEELRDALAEELASAGFAFTSMEYDWRKRRVVTKDLVATKLPDGVAAFNIGEVVYRGAKPADIRAAFAEEKAEGKPRELITDLTLSDLRIGLNNGGEYKQASLTLKHLSLGKAIARDTAGLGGTDWVLQTADIARRLHVRLFEAEDMRFWHPESQSTFEQKLLRLEDYRAGNFSEFRVEGFNLAIAVAMRMKLDEYFVESVKARRFLDNLHRTPEFAAYKAFVDGFMRGFNQAMGEKGGESGQGKSAEPFQMPSSYPPASETAIIVGDDAAIGFEMLIPAVGRIAFEEISATDRQFLKGLEVGGKSKIVALELQFNMLTRMLTAGLDYAGVDLAELAFDAGSGAEAWLEARAGNPVGGEGPVTASLQTNEGEGAAAEAQEGTRQKAPEQTGKENDASTKSSPKESNPESEKPADESKPDAADEDQVPTGPSDGKVEQGPAAPVPDVWGNKIEPPKAKPELNNKKIAEYIRKLGFDDLRIDSESVAAFDERTKVWEISKFVFDMQKFWGLDLNLRLSGMGALEEVGGLPRGDSGWPQGAEANAVGKRFIEEGRFEGFSFTYRDKGFISRLIALIAEENGVTMEALVNDAVAGLFSAEEGKPVIQAEGLEEAVKGFLIKPETFAIRFQPAEPVPFSAILAMNEEKKPVPEIASLLGMVISLNGETFEDFKKSAPISSDIESEED